MDSVDSGLPPVRGVVIYYRPFGHVVERQGNTGGVYNTEPRIHFLTLIQVGQARCPKLLHPAPPGASRGVPGSDGVYIIPPASSLSLCPLPVDCGGISSENLRKNSVFFL